MSHVARRVLITGGAGFIGSQLAGKMVDAGDHVTVLDDLSTGSLENIRHLLDGGDRPPPRGSFSFVHRSIFDAPALAHLVGEADIVIHLAAAVGVKLVIGDPVRAIETNIFGTREVLRMAQRFGSKVLIASSSEVYGDSPAAPFHESADCVVGSTTETRWSYAASKAIDEVLAFAYHGQFGVPVVVFRLFNTIGPRQSADYGMVVPRFVQQALAGEPLTVFGDGRQTRCFCDVDDTARAIVGLADAPEAVGGLFNIGSQEEISIRDLAELVIRIVDDEGFGPPQSTRAAGRTELVPYEAAYGRGFEDMRRRVPDIRRIQALTGWQPRASLPDALRRVVRFKAATDAVAR